MNIITLDMETYYSREYSLSKITTEEYIRDPMFEVIGVGVKVGNDPTEWASGSMEQIATYLRGFDWENSALLAHNTMFDGAILSWRFGIRPKAYLDTLSMARALHGTEVGGSLKVLVERYGLGAKGTEVLNALGKRRRDFTEEELSRYGDYCVNDVELTYKLFHKMGAGFPKKELKLIDLTLRMFTEPVLELDRPHLEQHLDATVKMKEQLLVDAGVTDKADLMSNPKFAQLLTQLSVSPPTKLSPTTGKEAFAFAKSDEEFKALLEHEDARVQALVAARLGNKSTLEETRTQRFINIAERGTLPVPIRYYAAHTGRWGGCLVADTEVTVFDKTRGVCKKKIVDVLADDLVWDGVEFVAHDGVVFSGYAEVIEWDGVRGTEDHVVFTDAGEISLRDAKAGGHNIQTAGIPDKDAVDSARHWVSEYEE
jgi:DNA polymerase